jgi:AbrB family looped-hinge helix DNA binding protein
MQDYRTQLGLNGRIVIPASYRKQLQLKPGDELVLHVEDDELRIFTLKHSLKRVQNAVHKYAKGKSLVEQLKKMRKKDAESE